MYQSYLDDAAERLPKRTDSDVLGRMRNTQVSSAHLATSLDSATKSLTLTIPSRSLHPRIKITPSIQAAHSTATYRCPLTAAQGSNSSTKATQRIVNTSMLIMNCILNRTVRMSLISMPNSIVKILVMGGGHEITVNTPEANIINTERLAWDNNYLILSAEGRGHYIGCNLSVTNFQGTWWGEGDDMIWVDGYKWPPDLHGTGSEDYLNQAWGMQQNAFAHNGSRYSRK